MPEGEDWGFPEVDAVGPTSLALPEPEEIVYDTGSDAWWRAQAQAQRAAADSEMPVPPVPDVEQVAPEVQRGDPFPSPLDRDWFPSELAAEPTEIEPAAHEAAEPFVAAEPAAAEQGAAPPDPLPAAPWSTPRPARPTLTPPPPPPPPAASARVTSPRPQVQDLPPPVPPEQATNRPTHEGAPVGPARALAGAAIAITGVLLGVGALYLFNQPDDKGSPVVASPPRATARSSFSPTPLPTPKASTVASSAPTSVPPVVVAPAARPAAAVVPVSVLNNSKIQRLAEQGAAQFRAGGWPVRLTGNYRGGTIARTTVYYAPGGLASAQRFAKQFGIPRVAPRFAGLPTTGMTVVLTRDYR
jgi:hypothetical protein